jgi:hypothetical protein
MASSTKTKPVTTDPPIPPTNMPAGAEVIDARTGTDVLLYDERLWPNLLSRDAHEVSAQFADQYSRAQTVEDLFGVLEGRSTKDMIGRKVQIRGVSWAPYASERGIIPNAICNGVDLNTGEALEFATTSQALTLFLRRAEMIDALPVDVRIVEKRTASGNTALNFERP